MPHGLPREQLKGVACYHNIFSLIILINVCSNLN